MALFRMPRFLRRFFRARMNPRTESEALSMKEKLSLAYMFIAWNGAGFVLWQIFGKGNANWPKGDGSSTEQADTEGSAFYYARALGINKGTVYRISGLNVDSKVTFQMRYDAAGNKTFETMTSNEKKLFGDEFTKELRPTEDNSSEDVD